MPERLPDIIDNSEGKKLGAVLNQLLEQGEPSVRIVTAYFNHEGFSILKNGLERAKEFKLLLGKEQEREFVIGDRLWNEMEIAMNKRETPPLLQELADFINQEKVGVRAFKQKFLHGKSYIIDGIPVLGSVGFVGSSNLTYAGLTKNYELNAVLKQESAVRELINWFDRFWNEAEDYKDELLDILTAFTDEYPPYEIYIKILYEYFRDRFELEVSPKEETPSPIILADFQHDGYLNALDILEKYGGVILADSVGLGKTFLALKLLDDYAYKLRQKALLICPAQLKELLWEPELRRASIRADIEHMEFVGRDSFNPAEYADFDLLVIDESHNFRNANTNRWENVFKLLTIGKPKKLVLLTATPVNNSIFDLYNQLRLITRDNNDFFAGCGINNLKGYFQKAEVDKENLYDVLEEIGVRRSRYFIKNNYPEAEIDGKIINFPKRELRTVRYSLEKSYSGLYKEVASTIENLYLAPYNPEAYRKGIDAHEFVGLKERLLREGWSEKDAQAYMMNLGRGTSLVQLMKTLYLKRLESSLTALKISLVRQRDFQKKFSQLLDRNKLLDSTQYRKHFKWNGEDEQENEIDIDNAIAQLPEADANRYDLNALKKFVKEDVNALNNIIEKLEKIEVQEDDKLNELKKLLLGDLKGKKVVVFTYFKDTARYLYHQLGGRREDGKRLPEGEKFLRRLGHERISIVDSIVDPRERKDRVIRFAPESNAQNTPLKNEIKGTEREIDLLISTDVLSEGQNLQDSDTVINYDLHWNPVRMVQRAGRIDRIGSLYDTVFVYNFNPEDALEDLLHLVERIYNKLEGINRSIGLDASVMGESPNPQDFNAIHMIAQEDGSIFDELEQLSEIDVGEFLKQELIDFIGRIGADKLKRIPLGMGSGIQREDRKGLFAAIKDEKNNRHFWLFYDIERNTILDRKLEVIKLIRCHEHEKRVEPDFDVYAILEKLKKRIVNQTKAVKHRISVLPNPQNHVMNWLQALPSLEERKQLIEYFSKPLSGLQIRELRRLWREERESSVEKLIAILHRFAEAHPHATEVQSSSISEISEEDLQLVGWIARV